MEASELLSPKATEQVVEVIKLHAEHLPADIDDPAFAEKFDRYATSGTKVILIGDGSHGTSEFYHARAAITKRLIERHGFRIVACEADWPDARIIDRYVHLPKERNIEMINPFVGAFKRFPRWMWRNYEVADFIQWLRHYNLSTATSADEQASFYGLDLYSMRESIHAVIKYLDRVDPDAAVVARKRYGCLAPWVDDPSHYGLEALSRGYAPCEKGVVRMLIDLLQKRAEYARSDGDRFFDAEINARVVRDAERYYVEMYYGRDESWNLRDTHMFDTLQRLIDFHGGAKAVVWAHNSHVGDARATSMTKRGELNIGQLCREKWGPTAVKVICCGTHTGTVAAAHNWDTPMVVMGVKPSLRDSYEHLMSATGLPSFMLDLRDLSVSTKGAKKKEEADDGDDIGVDANAKLRKALMKPLLERFIGVIYRPDTERWSHYSHAVMPLQMDAYVWFRESSAVRPLAEKEHPPVEDMALEETYPFGL